ncbi:MAG: DnaJ domain-containing protein [Chthoniobacterales bacterium]
MDLRLRYCGALQSGVSDYYTTLGLNRRCTTAQIRAAYRSLVKRHHPDVNAGSPEAGARSQRINAAYETLNDCARRRAYDHELRRTEAPPPRAKIERNVTRDVYLRIEDLFRGTSLEVRVNDPGNPDGVEVYQWIVPPDTAPGFRYKLPRTESSGGGFVQLRVHVLSGFRFKARGSDLHFDLRINARMAAAGGSEFITAPNGHNLQVEIPRGVRRGQVLRIRGEGLPKARGGRGDLLARVNYRPEVRVMRRPGLTRGC